jgi:hypothetical protein
VRRRQRKIDFLGIKNDEDKTAIYVDILYVQIIDINDL